MADCNRQQPESLLHFRVFLLPEAWLQSGPSRSGIYLPWTLVQSSRSSRTAQAAAAPRGKTGSFAFPAAPPQGTAQPPSWQLQVTSV